jgi:hypothetical protein
MLGEINASPSVLHFFSLIEKFNFLHCGTFLGLVVCRRQTSTNSENDKRRTETRLNGGSPKSFVFDPPLKALNSNPSIEPSAWVAKLPRIFFENQWAKMDGLLFKISLGDTNDSTLGNPVPMRMSPRQLPGVYMVLCLVNNKRYYGESKNVSARLSQHKSKLRRNIHEVSELQRDYNLYGEENFEFSCLYIAKDMSLEQRQAYETELIGRFYALCYNKSDKVNHKGENHPFWGKSHSDSTRRQMSESAHERKQNSTLEGFPILLKDEVFPSLSEASRQTGHSRDTIRRWLNDPMNPICVALDASQPHQRSEILDSNSSAFVENTGLRKEVSLYGVTYSSIAEAARQRNCSRSNIQRLLRNHPQDCFIIKAFNPN